jgi:1,2-diacylglycerol 3-alpha-glucosyltransferase
MRIGIFTNNYLPNPYGVSGSVESFRKEFEKAGHEVYIFAPQWIGYRDENPRVFRYPSFDIKVKNIKYPLPVPYSHRIGKIIKKIDLDIIHSQHPNLLGTAAARWAKKKKIPLVFTWHTLYDKYAHFTPVIPDEIVAWYGIRSARNYANKCDQVIVPTPSVKPIVRKWGVTNENIEAVPTGVEEMEFANPQRNKIREKYGVRDDEILLTLISRLTEEKNIMFLFDVVKDILKKNGGVRFLLCGDGNLRNRITEISRKEKLENKVINVGNIERSMLKDYYAAGDIYVYASKSETQGMVLTEAMYSGLPIVAVRATGAVDIVENNRTGFLVSENKEEFAAAVQKLIDNGDLRKSFGEKAARVAREKYTSRVCAGKMLEAYEKVRGK